jgi:hypothetical protein
VWMRNHVHAGHRWRLPNLECKTDILVSISLAGLNHCTSVSYFLPTRYNSDIQCNILPTALCVSTDSHGWEVVHSGEPCFSDKNHNT